MCRIVVPRLPGSYTGPSWIRFSMDGMDETDCRPSVVHVRLLVTRSSTTHTSTGTGDLCAALLLAWLHKYVRVRCQTVKQTPFTRQGNHSQRPI